MVRLNNHNLSRRYRGSIIVYSVIVMTVMLAMISLGVDYGRVQSVKSELQRSADATALGVIQEYVKYGGGGNGLYAGNVTQPLMTAYNPVDANSGVAPTVTMTWGSWNTVSNTFTPGFGPAPVAVQVTVSRTAANGRAVPLTFPLVSGKGTIRRSMDVIGTATAVTFSGQSTNTNTSAQSDPWLAGMPNGATASDGDTAPSQSPAMAMNVVPGSIITVTNVSGTMQHDPAIAADSADGSSIFSHMCDDGNGLPVQNNIGDVVAPIDSLLGIFLSSTAPNLNPAPTVVRDYSTSASRDKTAYNDIQSQQPFYIGNGTTSGGTVQQFRVPPGCTRLYLGTMDGHQWNNNSGSYAATVTQSSTIQLIQ